jgi:hypothetical protein
MIKSEWLDMLDTQIEKLRNDAVELGQNAMLDNFYEQENQRVDLFNRTEDIGHPGEMKQLFNDFQGYYKYVFNTHFTSLSMNTEKGKTVEGWVKL